MKIQIIKVPYDCGYRKQRQGLGPDRFLKHNIDMDAFDVGGGAANHYGATGGLTPEFMIKAIALVKDYIPVRGCAIASYDPAFDSDSRFLEAGIQSIRQIVSVTSA